MLENALGNNDMTEMSFRRTPMVESEKTCTELFLNKTSERRQEEKSFARGPQRQYAAAAAAENSAAGHET